MRLPPSWAAAICVLGALGAPAGAAAAPSWLSAQDLSAPGGDAGQPQVAADPAGDAVAVWARSNGSDTIIQSSSRIAGGSWIAPVDLSAAGRDAGEPQVSVDSGGDVAAVWSRSDSAHTIIQAATRGAGGTWTAPKDLSAAERNAEEPQVASDAAGDVVAVWKRYNGTHFIVQAATRPAGGAWSGPTDISALGGSAREPQVALDPAGNAIAVWARDDGSDFIVQAATRPAGGAWSEPIDLSEGGENAETPQVALDAAGDMAIVWARKAGVDKIVQAATRPAGGAWSEPVDLSAPGAGASEPQVAVDPGGGAAATWMRSGNVAYSYIQAATHPAGGAWSEPVNLSPVNQIANEPQIAAGPGGEVQAIWARSDGSPTIIQVAARPPGGGWLPATRLSEFGKVAGEPQLALDPGGNGVAVWSRDNGSNDVVQTAGYDGAGPQLRSLSIPGVATVAQPVSFSVAPFDVWSAVPSIGWAFGDGEGAYGASTAHSFGSPGTFQVTVTAADALANTGDAQASITVYPKARAGRIARVRRKRAMLRLYCPSPAGCEGSLRLIAGMRVRHRRHLVGRRVTIGRASFSIPGGRASTVPVRLNHRGVVLVGRASRRGLKAQLTGPGVRHRVVVLLPHR